MRVSDSDESWHECNMRVCCLYWMQHGLNVSVIFCSLFHSFLSYFLLTECYLYDLRRLWMPFQIRLPFSIQAKWFSLSIFACTGRCSLCCPFSIQVEHIGIWLPSCLLSAFRVESSSNQLMFFFVSEFCSIQNACCYWLTSLTLVFRKSCWNGLSIGKTGSENVSHCFGRRGNSFAVKIWRIDNFCKQQDDLSLVNNQLGSSK